MGNVETETKQYCKLLYKEIQQGGWLFHVAKTSVLPSKDLV